MANISWDFSIEAVVMEVEVSQKGDVANMRWYDSLQAISSKVQLCNSLMPVAAFNSMPVAEVVRTIP